MPDEWKLALYGLGNRRAANFGWLDLLCLAFPGQSRGFTDH
jgi:hypothetical protein